MDKKYVMIHVNSEGGIELFVSQAMTFDKVLDEYMENFIYYFDHDIEDVKNMSDDELTDEISNTQDKMDDNYEFYQLNEIYEINPETLDLEYRSIPTEDIIKYLRDWSNII